MFTDRYGGGAQGKTIGAQGKTIGAQGKTIGAQGTPQRLFVSMKRPRAVHRLATGMPSSPPRPRSWRERGGLNGVKRSFTEYYGGGAQGKTIGAQATPQQLFVSLKQRGARKNNRGARDTATIVCQTEAPARGSPACICLPCCPPEKAARGRYSGSSPGLLLLQIIPDCGGRFRPLRDLPVAEQNHAFHDAAGHVFAGFLQLPDEQ